MACTALLTRGPGVVDTVQAELSEALTKPGDRVAMQVIPPCVVQARRDHLIKGAFVQSRIGA
ncbi:uncharacterized protein AMSG_12355 [Thecamonas trahens ATCC 50062]|uniref:Uncharacterized protein n=1 Tax=Thecamonas trahens ATCC 50062 TaxID=461836 RepID=A0A0L0DQC6_THETB|nr:hypothetical protein AMSG_12355 [Thecamonas trahens ATCC 50062]KNC54475.1 hypothetical protein AMSG_12355 [Thecamonas trahens ATCC 50062]|eukprot:XP_013753668.1 hypothetical protein AMSG_12355 [Thecamonas trahens ATCC 50062]